MPNPGSVPLRSATGLLQAALRSYQAGQLGAAESTLRHLLTLQPDDANALHLLGLVAQQAGRSEDATGLLRRAVAQAPRSTIFLCNLATVLIAQGQHAQAAACHERAVALRPDDATALNGLGVSRLAQGRLDDARACFERVLRTDPKHDLAHYNLGVVEQQSGRPAQAIAQFERAVALNPRHAQAYNDWGAALRSLGRIDEAVARFEQATALQPDLADAFYNLGTVLLEQSRLDAALASLRRCQALRPQTRNALRIATAMPVIHASVAAIDADRQRFGSEIAALMQTDLTIDDPLDAALGPSFFLAYHGRDNRALQEALAAVYLKACPALAAPVPVAAAPRRPGARLRIGFVSNFLHDHTVGDVMHGLIEQIDRRRFDVTVFRFPGPSDDISRRIDSAADRVVMLERRVFVDRVRIAQEGLDLLVYPEVGMDPATYFLAFGRLAPVQCVMWGHPDTTGIANLDYCISAADTEPDGAQAVYGEKLVRLSAISACYQRPTLLQDAATATVESFGLSADAHLYLCPQTLYKFHPDFDPVLAALLRRDPRAVLVVFHGRSRHWGEQLMQRFRRHFPDAVDRVRFLDRLPKQAYFSLLRRAHAVLDTLHFGGGNTSYQALGLGVPLVTWCGQFARGRFTYALYKQMGMTDLVADSTEAYVELAFRLANDAPFRAAIVERIERLSPAIFDNVAAVRELEGFFESVAPAAQPAG